MQLFYPYNERLPTQKAHDVYVWKNCVSLAQAGADVYLGCGRGSFDAGELAQHYQTDRPVRFNLVTLPILRKNWGLPMTWNRIFFHAAQRWIKKNRPEWVALSVRKQGLYHLQRKLPGVRYVYEVHELACYPSTPFTHLLEQERSMLETADLVTVTTTALKKILVEPPYLLTRPIELVPLAINAQQTTIIDFRLPLEVMYVGQLYRSQGVADLIQAVGNTPDVHLTVIGGNQQEIAKLKAATPSSAHARVHFLGFVPPAELPSYAARAHVFVAPFNPEGRMPYVAHTKLLEYISWRRPVIAPDLSIVHEHFPDKKGLLCFSPGDISSLTAVLRSITQESCWQKLAAEIQTIPVTDWQARSRLYLQLLSQF